MKHKLFSNFLTYIFIGTLFISCFIIIFGDFGYDLHLLKMERKNPKRESFPKITNLYKSPKKIDSYFNYHFPFKKFFLRIGNSALFYLLNVSTTKKVVIGKNNWLFNGDEFIDIAQGKLFTEDELKSLKRFFLKREKFFNSKNIEYILFFATDKESVYPEYYSSKYQPLAKYNRYDQLYDYLKSNTTLDVIYPKEHVRNSCNSSTLPCYFKFDSHWNDIGAFYAYQKIYDSLLQRYPSLVAPTLDDFNIHYSNGNKGFISVLGVYETDKVNIQSPFLIYKDTNYIDYLDDIRTSIELEANNTTNVTKYTNTNPNSSNLIPRIVLWGDSFSVRLTKYFVYNAKETVNVRHADKVFKLESIKNFRPTIVIDEFLTRKISRLKTLSLKRLSKYSKDK